MAAVSVTAAGLFAGGLLITGFNFYLSWIRVPLLRRVRNAETVTWVSGIPLVGSAALWLSVAFLPAGSAAIPVAIGTSLLDTGGIHWFVGTMIWRRLRGR